MIDGAARREPGVLALCAAMVRLALRRWPGLVGVSATMAADAVINVAKPWPLAIIVNDVLGSRKPSGWETALVGPTSRGSLLDWALAAAVVLFVAGWALGIAGNYAQIAYGQRLTYDLAERLLAHLHSLSLGTHSRRRVGDTIRRVTSDCGCVATIVVDGLLPAVTGLVSLVLMFAIMVRIDASLALVAVSILPLLVICIRRYADPMSERGYRLEEEESALYDHVEQTLSAIALVQASSTESNVGKAMRSASDRVLRATLAQVNAQLRFKFVTGLLMALGLAAAFWVGGEQAMSGKLSTGTIIVFASYLYSLYQPVESVMYTASTVQAAMGSARRVSEVLALPPEVEDVPGAVPLTSVQGHVAFEHVSFGYEAGRPVLEDVSFEVEPGQVAAIVGATGAGKSTLAGLVPRFYDPVKGRVLLDGHDVRSVQLASLRRQVSVVLQEPLLFPVSIAENIAYGRPDATRAEVVSAAMAADLDDFVARLPSGYDTIVGERGATLSGGERQRVAIARALLKNAPLLILDEPTSALDVGTESRVLKALDALMAGRTTIVIAHRLSTIRAADVIFVLSGGRVAEQGSHDQLLSAGGLYTRLHGLQYSGTDAATVSEPRVAPA